MEEKEQGFEVVDRRRVNADSDVAEEVPEPTAPPQAAEALQGEAPEAAEAPPEEGAPAWEEEAAMGAGLPPLDIQGLLVAFVATLRDFAWLKMGIVANPATGKTETDMPQAKTAIDTAQFMMGQLEGKLPDGDVRELRRIMMDLQMNYLRRSGGES